MRFSRTILALFAALSLLAGGAFADDKALTPSDKADTGAPDYLRKTKGGSNPTTKASIGSQTSEISGIRVAFALALLGGLGATAIVLKRKKLAQFPAVKGISLRAVSSLSLPGKSHVTLVSVGGEAMLLGISESGMTLLRTFSKDELGTLDSETTEASSRDTSPSLAVPLEKTKGAKLAFRDILDIAAQNDARLRAERAHIYAESLTHETRTRDDADEIPDSGPRSRDEEDDELPPHLALALAESRGRDAFGAPDGQASELARRFKERKS